MVGKDREPTTVSDTVNKIAEAPAFDNQFPAGRLTIITALDVDGNSISQFLESRVDGLFEELPIPAENSMHSQEKKENSGFSSSFNCICPVGKEDTAYDDDSNE